MAARESDELCLSCGESELGLDCRSGGSVLFYRRSQRDLLRPATGDSVTPTSLAAFPLIPFAGRITDGRFRFRGSEIRLPSNFPPETHAIHGQAWQGIWSVADRTEESATLEYRYSDRAWPWRYRALQHFELCRNLLQVTMSLTNLGPGPMPAGLGWHPYFGREGAYLQADVTDVWRRTGTAVAGRPAATAPGENIRRTRRVDELRLDHCFSLAQPPVRIAWPDVGVALELVPDEVFRHLVVYVPAGEDFFCVEPISHAPDAVNSPLDASATGLRIVDEGATLNGCIRLHSSLAGG